MSQPLPGFESTLRRRWFGPSQVFETGTYKMGGNILHYLGLLTVKTPVPKGVSVALGDRSSQRTGLQTRSPSEPRGRAQPHCSGSFSNAAQSWSPPVRGNGDCAALRVTAGLADLPGKRPELPPSVRFCYRVATLRPQPQHAHPPKLPPFQGCFPKCTPYTETPHMRHSQGALQFTSHVTQLRIPNTV